MLTDNALALTVWARLIGLASMGLLIAVVLRFLHGPFSRQTGVPTMSERYNSELRERALPEPERPDVRLREAESDQQRIPLETDAPSIRRARERGDQPAVELKFRPESEPKDGRASEPQVPSSKDNAKPGEPSQMGGEARKGELRRDPFLAPVGLLVLLLAAAAGYLYWIIRRISSRQMTRSSRPASSRSRPRSRAMSRRSRLPTTSTSTRAA